MCKLRILFDHFRLCETHFRLHTFFLKNLKFDQSKGVILNPLQVKFEHGSFLSLLSILLATDMERKDQNNSWHWYDTCNSLSGVYGQTCCSQVVQILCMYK